MEVLAGDAHGLVADSLSEVPADIIVASCGFDTIPVGWVRRLKDGGRLLIPLTGASGQESIGSGAMLLVRRRGAAFDANFVSRVFIYNDRAGRSDAATARLAAVLPAGGYSPNWAPPAIASLRLDTPPDDSCWLAGDGWWLSTAPEPA